MGRLTFGTADWNYTNSQYFAVPPRSRVHLFSQQLRRPLDIRLPSPAHGAGIVKLSREERRSTHAASDTRTFMWDE